MRLLDPQLEAFLAIVKHKTVHGAADELYLTQTAITQRIRALEVRLQTSLFVRSRRGMLLTQEGEALLRYCQQIEPLEGEALSAITKSAVAKHVTVCITGPSTIMHTRVIPSCIRIANKYPKLSLQFDINDRDNRIDNLRKNISQLAIIEKQHLSSEMEAKALKPEVYVLVGPIQWKGRKLDDIMRTERIIDFDRDDQMTFHYLKVHDLFDAMNNERHFCNRTTMLPMLISNGLGYGVLPLEFARPFIKNNELMLLNKGKTYTHELVLSWYPRHQLPNYFAELINCCE